MLNCGGKPQQKIGAEAIQALSFQLLMSFSTESVHDPENLLALRAIYHHPNRLKQYGSQEFASSVQIGERSGRKSTYLKVRTSLLSLPRIYFDYISRTKAAT